MDKPRQCAQCGVALSDYAVEGLCGNCLLKPGLDPVTELQDERVRDKLGVVSENAFTTTAGTNEVRRFGDYELLEEIARGGMGVIYRARQLSLERIVAVKMILAGPFASKQTIQRFRGEVTAAALLQHPNIVAIHDVGIHDDQHYFSMDYVEGQNLSQLVGNRPLTPARAASYVKLVAEAIHYAHGQGILHRDLKPSNVLVDANDQPRITDFGLAKRLDGNASMTVTGQMLGSPNFMPPEQASSERGKVGRHSDVYGLGAILYHLLTARPPFQAESFESVITQVLDAEPVSPRLLNSSVPPDLETICVKCLQKEPSRRYQSAQELADELGRFLRDEPIQARPITRAERAWRWCRRKPALAGLVVALHLVLALGLTGVLWQWRRATVSESQTRRNLYTADMNRVQQAWDEGSLQRAEDLLRAHLPKAGKEDLRGFEWRYLSQLCRDESRHIITSIHFAGQRTGLALAADGQTVIAANGDSIQWLNLPHERQVQSLTVGTNPITVLLTAKGQPGLLAYHTDRVRVLSATGESLLGGGLAPEFAANRKEDLTQLGVFALSWDGTRLAASGTNGTVGIFDAKTGQPLGPIFRVDEKDAVWSLAFSPDGQYLACATTEIHILETAPQLKRVSRFKAHNAFIPCLAFDPAGKMLASGGFDSHIRLWRFPDGLPLRDLAGHKGMIGDLAFSPDGRRLASGGGDHTVRLWDLASPGPPTFLHGHRGVVTSVLFSTNGNELFTASADRTVKSWDVSGAGSTNILRLSNWTDEVSFSPDGTLVAVSDYDRRNAVLFRLRDRLAIDTFGDYPELCRGVKFSPDGKVLVTSGDSLQIWSVSPKVKRFDWPGGDIALHPTKSILAILGADLRFRDWQTGQPVNLLPHAPANGVTRVAFSRDGKQIALGMGNGQVSVWDIANGKRLFSFHKHSLAVNVLCFSRCGPLLASGGMDNSVVLYDLAKGVTASLENHTMEVTGLAFAPDDKTLVSTSADGRILFWCLANGQVALTLVQGGGPMTSVTFSPDGNLMATSGCDGTATLWPAASLEPTLGSQRAHRGK